MKGKMRGRRRVLSFWLSREILVIGCAHTSNGKSAPISYNELIEKYSNDYFVGVGYGSGNSEQLALKIAKIRAQAALAENIKITILSKTELMIEEKMIDDSYTLTESFKEKLYH